MTPWVYDSETYPNLYLVGFFNAETGQYDQFEVSDWRDDTAALVAWTDAARQQPTRLVGYNNVGFDYPILHLCIASRGEGFSAAVAYEKCQRIINSSENFSTVAPWDVTIPQVDLFKIHHFDNKAKRTSLKQLQFVMRSQSVEDLPFPPGTVLTAEQAAVVRSYMFHDITETYKFYVESLPLIAFRDELSGKYGYDHTNFNDTKIGKTFFVNQLEARAPGSCYESGGRSRPRQTIRDRIALRDVIFPYIKFERPEFQRVHQWLLDQTIASTKGVFKPEDTDVVLDGFTFQIRAGGIHGSVSAKSYQADDEWCIFDIDVSGYYPSISVVNRLYPAHLGEAFCDVYADVIALRRQYKKGTVENAMLKLAGNGTYGDSGNPYSPFYDQAYLLKITMNGQLMLCMLAEQLVKVPGLELIQVNTDGMTMRVQRDQLLTVRLLTGWWQEFTRLTLEEQFYSAMYVRDANAYIAVDESGKVKKRKGPFSWVHGPNLGDGELAWHQDHSALIIPMAAEAHLREGADIAEYVMGHRDLFDFMLFARATGGSRLELDDGTQMGKTLRYYVAREGRGLRKIMPLPPEHTPGDYKRANGLTDAYFRAVQAEIGGSSVWDARIHTKNRSQYEPSKPTSIQAGWKVAPCNDMRAAARGNIDHAYYIAEARALVGSVGVTLA